MAHRWMFHNKSRKCTLVKCAPKAGEYYDGSNACSSKICTNTPEVMYVFTTHNEFDGLSRRWVAKSLDSVLVSSLL